MRGCGKCPRHATGARTCPLHTPQVRFLCFFSALAPLLELATLCHHSQHAHNATPCAYKQRCRADECRRSIGSCATSFSGCSCRSSPSWALLMRMHIQFQSFFSADSSPLRSSLLNTSRVAAFTEGWRSDSLCGRVTGIVRHWRAVSNPLAGCSL